ncbi:methyltransferase domain-containing protein [Halorubellus sp. JP-L1]|uniref:class I SAM-dependent methyltransferase n=1 Tax=Halorubellus sp. JP-L1 TaxID=2715753 RepID=UPI00140E0A68|nr:class I SAM-dependent methyltransferase [Halorubellus sp. JP-L1]NHN42511.1 methyltransferase domain-containing protein [Halorubellus sp. JP-L1]
MTANATAEDAVERASSVQSFYGRWATLYDGLARFTPGIGRLRREAVAALELDPGDVVVDLGCGTGANLPFLRDAVGPTGTVVGVDLTAGMLSRARRLVDARGWRNVHVVQGDATRPPVGGPVDGVLASFVVGMLDDPAAAVADWCDLVHAESTGASDPMASESFGNVVLVDAALSDRAVARPLNAAFRALTVLSTPPTLQFRYDPSPHDVLRERVRTARDALRERSSATAHREHLLGVVRVTGGRIQRAVVAPE